MLEGVCGCFMTCNVFLANNSEVSLELQCFTAELITYIVCVSVMPRNAFGRNGQKLLGARAGWLCRSSVLFPASLSNIMFNFRVYIDHIPIFLEISINAQHVIGPDYIPETHIRWANIFDHIGKQFFLVWINLEMLSCSLVSLP